ncbi:ATP-binding cassette domain-containing protein [Bacillus mangrovi]|uniref:ATP-binding cassette domain-containing protein n=1 Tax=Metabacillus mangrovi TaxID=1491830 RepID=A0A7X2V622_9BACI|nr:ABC transporter ATP-binding protein [Metabacillus mangrovi]MTH55422.1 ATP-binding cassette domain-containing protein [Metabacillus mangrovi]
MIKTENIEKYFTNGNEWNHVVKNISLAIPLTSFTAITGKSGSGKSTLLNLLCGIDQPFKGRIHINGNDITSFSKRKLTKWRNAEIGIVFQSFHLLPSLTLIENVMLPMEFSSNKKNKKSRAAGLLQKVGLENKANMFPDYVSGGEKQRAAIARALANDPPVLFADEPTGNLDTENAAHIMELFLALKNENKTIVMVTHDLELAGKTDKIIHMKDGQIIEGPAAAPRARGAGFI